MGFEDWYKIYPRREKRLLAERAYLKALKKADAEELYAGVERFNAHLDRHPRKRKYIPLPASWLNAGQWMDDLPSTEKGSVKLSDERKKRWQQFLADGVTPNADMRAILRENGFNV